MDAATRRINLYISLLPCHNIPENFNLDAGANEEEEPKRDVPAEKALNVADSIVDGSTSDGQAVAEGAVENQASAERKIEKEGEDDRCGLKLAEGRVYLAQNRNLVGIEYIH